MIFFTSPLKPLNGIQRKLTGSKIFPSSTKFVFFGPIGKTRWRPWPLIGCDFFYFSSETAEQNSTKVDRKQEVNVLYKVFFFLAGHKKNCRPGSHLIRDELLFFYVRIPFLSYIGSHVSLIQSLKYIEIFQMGERLDFSSNGQSMGCWFDLTVSYFFLPTN